MNIIFRNSDGIKHILQDTNGKICQDCAAGLDIKAGSWRKDLLSCMAEIISEKMDNDSVIVEVKVEDPDKFMELFSSKQSFAFSDFI